MPASLVASSYLAVITIGLIHGLEPGHGWPVAALLSTKVKSRYAYGATAAMILSAGHFISSIAVVVIYYLATFFLGTTIDFSTNWFKVLTAAVLLVLAYRFFTEKEHTHVKEDGHAHASEDEAEHQEAHRLGLKHEHHHSSENQVVGLKGLAGFAFFLGFAHEEEFMLFALFVGGVDPLVGMTSYALAVTASLVAITLVAIKAFSAVEDRMERYQKYIPKITGIVLAILAILFLLPVFGGPSIY